MRLHPDLWLDLTGSTHLDCWGLVREVFRRRGVSVAVTDDWQRIPEPEPGALVMLGPTHVGVCLDAGEFIHVRAGSASSVANLKAARRAGVATGFYRHLGALPAATFDPAAPDAVRVVLIPRPVDRPTERTVTVVPWTPGMTVGAVAPSPANVYMAPEGPLALAGASCVPVAPGSTVLFVVAPALGAALVPLLVGIGLSLVSFGLQILLAPKAPDARREDSSPSFDLSGLRNTAAVGVAQPVVYGERRVAGNFVSAYQQVDASGAASLYLLVLLSRGPIQSIAGLTEDADDLRGADIPDGIEIDGNAARNYDCSVSVRLGSSEQEPIPGFGDVVTAYAQTPTLSPSTPFTYTTTGEVDGYDIQLTFPTGLVDVTSSGSFANRTVRFYVRHRVVGAATWTEETWILTEAKNVPFVRQFSKRGLTRDRYEVQIERYPGDGILSAPWPESAPKFFSQSVLTAVNEITGDLLSRPGRALLALKIRATDQLSGSIPTITTTVEGRKVWIWDGLSTTAPNFGSAETYSDNPAWVGLDMLLNRQYGLGRSGRLGLDNIHLDDFQAWADLCDALEADGRGGTTERARCDAIFDAVGSGWQAFVDLCRSAWAEPYIAGNKVRLALLAPSSPVFLFGSGNSRDVTISTLGRSQRPNAVEVQYANEEADYDADSATRVDEAAVFTDGQQENRETIGTVGVTRPAQAYRLAAFRRNWHHLIKQRAEWTGGPDSLHLLPGEVVALVAPGVFDGASGRTLSQENSDEIALDRTITTTATAAIRIIHEATDTIETAYIPAGTYARGSPITITDASGTPGPTWTTNPAAGTRYVVESLSVQARRRLFRIESIAEDQGQSRRFVGTSYDADVFDDDFGDLEDFTDALPNARGIPAAASRVTATENPVDCCDAIHVTFDPVETWQRAEVWYRVATASEGGWRFAGWSRGALVISPVAAGVTYEVAVAVVSTAGTRQTVDAATRAVCYVRGHRGAPDSPTAITAEVTLGRLDLAAVAPADHLIAGYEWRYGNGWAGSICLARTGGPSWSGPCPWVGTARVRVRTFSRAGVYSDDEATDSSVTHTVAESVYLTDINSAEASGFSGTKTDTVVTSSQLALDTGDLSGTYVTADKSSTITKEVQELRILATGLLANVAMTWDEACFAWESPLASSLTWATSYLSGAEIAAAEGLTWDAAGFTWDSMPAAVITWDGPTDVYAALTPTLEYDVNTGSGFSGSYTTFRTPVSVPNLTGTRVRATLRRPHTRYDPRLSALTTTTLALASSEPERKSFYHQGTTATAVNATTAGISGTTSTNAALKVPTGYKLVGLEYVGVFHAGATVGTYKVKGILRNVTDASNVIIGEITGAENTELHLSASFDRVSSTVTLAAGKEYMLGWYNDSTSPGALAGSAHHVNLTAILEPV